VGTAKGGPPKLPVTLAKRATAILAAAAPAALAGAAKLVAERWIAGLAPLEPVLVRATTSSGSGPAPKRAAQRAPKKAGQKAAQKPAKASTKSSTKAPTR
jgi:hypothetical protein